MSQTMQKPEDIRTFVKAGNARITLSSKKTDARYTYRVAKVDGAEDKFFVSLLTGPDNENSYSYIGLMDREQFRTTKKSRLNDDSTPVKAFRFFCDQVLAADVMPNSLEVRHEGRCGRCARALTVPESIDRGIGPECWGKMT